MARAYGVIWAGNFGMVLAHATSALSFYFCCRILKFARVWSFVGALLFAFTYYNTSRRLGHLLLVFSYTLPFAVLSCWLIASSQRLRPGKFYWICLATAVVMGLSNPYNLNMYLQLLGFALLVKFILGRRNINLRVGILSLALVAAAFIAINLGTLFYEWQHGRNADAVARNYFESELNALKPIEMVMPPPGHHLKIMADLGGKYEHLVLWKGEMY